MCKKAIIVDNDFFFAEFMAKLLSDQGYETVKAYDGKEGMQALDSDVPPDLLFLDVILPKVDGWTLIRYTKKRFPKRRFPIFVVSATVIEQLEELDRIGADYYIAKGPLRHIRARIKEIFRQKQSRPTSMDTTGRVFEMGNLFPRRESVALIESLHYQQAVTESLGMGVLIVDRDTRVLSTNTRALRLFGKTEADVWNRPIAGLFLERDRTQLIEAMKKVARNPDLGKTVISLAVNGQPIRSLVTLFCLNRQLKGWIVTLENMEEEACVIAN